MLKFLNERISVIVSDDKNELKKFIHNGKEHSIQEVIKVWQDAAFQAPGGRRGSARQWWNQRGRTFYRVIADDNITYEMYHDPRKDQWFLSKIWDMPDQDED